MRGIIDNQRNGLETQAKALMTSMIRPDIRFTLEPCNFTLNIFQDFVFTYFKHGITMSMELSTFQIFLGGRQGQTSPLNVLVGLF